MMKGGATEAMIDEAAAWHARIDAPGMDWDAFEAWLAAGAAHREAYDRIALIDGLAEANASALLAALPANDVAAAPSHHRRWWGAGGLVAAAAVAGIVMLPRGGNAPTPPTLYATDAGATRTIALADGSTVRLDRASRLAVAKGARGAITLLAGAAYFSVKHDPASPLTLSAGPYRITDIGTRFEAVREAGRLEVAVAEGAVSVARDDGPATEVTAGHRLDLIDGDDSATMQSIDPASVAGWRQGRLVYRDAPLTLVAADISRYAGTTLVPEPGLSDMRFSGVLTIGDGSQLVGQLQALLPVVTRKAGARTLLVRRSGS